MVVSRQSLRHLSLALLPPSCFLRSKCWRTWWVPFGAGSHGTELGPEWVGLAKAAWMPHISLLSLPLVPQGKKPGLRFVVPLCKKRLTMKNWIHHKKLLKFPKKLVPRAFIIILFLLLPSNYLDLLP